MFLFYNSSFAFQLEKLPVTLSDSSDAFIDQFLSGQGVQDNLRGGQGWSRIFRPFLEVVKGSQGQSLFSYIP